MMMMVMMTLLAVVVGVAVVVVLRCRLYFTLTEAPASLARNTKGGVPDYLDFLGAAVRATWEGSAWCGDIEGFCRWLGERFMPSDELSDSSGGKGTA